MSNVSQWSTTAASNNSASPNGAPEGMAPSGVNDTMRENMAAMAKVYKDQAGGKVTTGTGTAYVLSTNNSHAALADIGLTVFRIHTANTGSATLAVDGLTAKTMKIAGANLVSGDLPQDSLVAAAYNSTGDVFDLFVFPAGGVTKTGTETLANKTMSMAGFLTLGPGTTLTIATGAVTATGSYHKLDTEGSASTDDLDTINGGADGRLIFLSTISGTRDVVLKHNTGNIYLNGADVTLGDARDMACLLYDDGRWNLVSFSDN